jgi:hypothetical protein
MFLNTLKCRESQQSLYSGCRNIQKEQWCHVSQYTAQKEKWEQQGIGREEQQPSCRNELHYSPNVVTCHLKRKRAQEID